jgi:hypothetical protein
MVRVINEKTLIPLSLFIVLVGVIVWLTNIYFLANANAHAIKTFIYARDRHNEIVAEQLIHIERSLNKLDGKIDVLIKKGLR